MGDVDKKMLDFSDLVTTTVLDTQIIEVKNKILDASTLVTTTVLKIKTGEAANKIPNHDAYIPTQAFNKLMAENPNERLKQADLVNKNDFANKLISFNKKLPQIKQNIQEVQRN